MKADPSATGDEPQVALSLEDAAGELGVHYMTAYRYVRTGRLTASKVGSQWQVLPKDLTEFATGLRPRGPTASGDESAPTQRDHHTELLRALVDGDESVCWQITQDALASSHTPESLYMEVLGPTMRVVGSRWADQSLSVADEHLATACMTRLVGRLGPLFTRRGTDRGVVVLAAPPGDSHALACALAADPIRGRRFAVRDLGGNTPIESIITGARAPRVVAVGLIGSDARCAEQLQNAIASVRATTDVAILVGGAAVADPESALRAGATAVIEATAQALDWLEQNAPARRARPGATVASTPPKP